MNAPDFEPQRIQAGNQPDKTREFQDGDSVQLRDTAGNLRTGVILERLPSGRYRVKSDGATAAMNASDLKPANNPIAKPNDVSPVNVSQPFKNGSPVIARLESGEIVTGEYHQPTQTAGRSLVKIAGSSSPMRATNDSEIHAYNPKFEAGQEVRFPFAKGNADYHGFIHKVYDDGTYEVGTEIGRVMDKYPAHLIEPRSGPILPVKQPDEKPTHDPQSIAAHLKAGGEAYYHPDPAKSGPDPGKLDLHGNPANSEKIPLHSVWMNDEKNLSELVNFDDVNAGNARIEMSRPQGDQGKSKPSQEPIDRMHDLELKYLIRQGDAKQFDVFHKDDRESVYGKHSLGEMLGDKSKATDENIATWIQHARKSAAQCQNPEVVKSERVVEQLQANRDAPPSEKPSSEGGLLDSVQTGLDGVGTVEPTPFADGSNALISLLRAASDPKRRGEHLVNAGISALGVIPYVGDLAKGFKYGGRAVKARAGGEKAARASGLKSLAENIAGIASQFIGASRESAEEAGGMAGGGNGGSGANDPPGDSTAGANGDGDDGLEKNIKPLSDKVVELTGFLGKAAVATYSAANAISLMNRAAIEYHRNLTGFNGQISGAYGKLEADRIHRKIKEGSDIAAPLSNLVSSQSELESVLQNFNSPFRQMAMDVQTGLTDLATIGIQVLDLLEPLSEMYPVIRIYLQRWGLIKDSPVFNQSMDWINGIRKQAEDNAKRGRKI